MAAGTSTVDPFPFFSNESIRAARRHGPKIDRNLEMNVPAELVFDTVARYMVLIGIADERWKISAARNCCHRFMLLTTDVLALVSKR